MADIVSNVAPTSLAEFEGLVGDKDVARKVFLHTIRDYMPFFDQAVIVRGNDGRQGADRHPLPGRRSSRIQRGLGL